LQVQPISSPVCARRASIGAPSVAKQSGKRYWVMARRSFTGIMSSEKRREEKDE
jgi:hypothetical protein